jgi:uncharacterized protein
MVHVYETASVAPLLWVALIAAAPLFEEVFFRGFLFEGFQHSKLGPIGTVWLTSLGWTVLHLQYGTYELGTIFVLGILFGVARLKTRSIYHPLPCTPSSISSPWFNLLPISAVFEETLMEVS